MCLPELGKTEDSSLGLLCCAGHLIPLILPMKELLTRNEGRPLGWQFFSWLL